MKILITVGTTPFDSLIRFCDENLDMSLDVTMQISIGASYIPKRFVCFKFANDILKHYREADVVITHAGAGTIFTLLEMGKRIVVFPNLDRDDRHQQDLAAVVGHRRWGIVCWRFEDLPEIIASAADFRMTPYENEFCGGPYISGMIRDLYSDKR